MLAMIGMGSFFGAALDTYSRLFPRLNRNIILLIVHDILFWITQALLIFYVLYLVNHGEIRFYIFIALLCGFAFYQSLLKNGYLKLLEKIIRFVKRTYRKGKNMFSVLIVRPVVVTVTFLFTALVILIKSIFRIITASGIMLFTVLTFFIKPVLFPASLLWKLFPESIKIIGGRWVRGISCYLERIYRFFIKK